MTEWWVGLPAAETRVDCGSETHTLRWHDGELHAADHDDIEGERTLAALGGTRCTCVDVVDAWARHADDPRVLTLASRGPADRLAVRIDWRSSFRRGRRGITPVGRTGGWMAYGPAGSGPDEVNDELVPLLGLGGGLPDRLVASVAAAWARRPPEDVAAVRAQLTASLYGRVVTVLRAWLGEPDLDVDVQLSDAGDASIERLNDGRIRAALPLGWLSDVWCRGVASFGGRLTLSVAIEADGSSWTLQTIAQDLRTVEQLRLAVRD
jgi:hypothetical protein